MDARPCRPRGAENALHQLHQRQKSSGNIASALTVPAAAFRGPAKRAAFGDVTNVSKGLLNSGRDEFKSVKMPANASSNININLAHATTTSTVSSKNLHVSANQNKENTLYAKDSFSRPAQRNAPLANKQKVLADSRLDAARKPMTTATTNAVQDSSVHLSKFDFDIPQQQQQQQQQPTRANAVPTKKTPALQAASADAPPLQPRHHKSQPQLKPQQPTLRRTQSKLEQSDPLSDKTDSSRQGSETMELPAHSNDFPSDHAYLDSLCAPSDADSRALFSQADDYAEVPLKLPDISEEPASDASYQVGPALTLSEPEECWDDDDDDNDDDDNDNDNDEDDYDEQDQAYITAHSTKSRDLTSTNVTTMLAPRVNARIQIELDNARMEVERTRPPEDIEEEAWDVSMVAEYGDEIFAYMRELEVSMSPNPHYMDLQTEIQWSMRSVLMDWVVQVHNRFNLLPETLFLTVNYIDRFLSCKVVSIGKLQLVGATAILVASKYEEINCPSLEEIVYMVDGGYTTEEVLKAERFMLSMLSFELGWPGPMSFLRRVSKADDYDLETRTLAKYFMELTIMDERFVASPPSFVAAGAHCLSRLILNKGYWTKHHVHYSGYTWGQLRSLITMMIECCENPQQHHGAIFDKYKEKRFKEASIIVQQALDAGFTLPHHSFPVRRSTAYPSHRNDVTDQPRTGFFLPI